MRAAYNHRLWNATFVPNFWGWVAAVWDRAWHPHRVVQPSHVWRPFFLCAITGGERRTKPETSEVAFFGEHELPAELSIRRGLLPQIQRMFDHLRRPELPTDNRFRLSTITMIAILTFSDSHSGVAVRRRVSSP